MRIRRRNAVQELRNRDPEYIKEKILQGKAIIALTNQKIILPGFCYIANAGREKVMLQIPD